MLSYPQASSSSEFLTQAWMQEAEKEDYRSIVWGEVCQGDHSDNMWQCCLIRRVDKESLLWFKHRNGCITASKLLVVSRVSLDPPPASCEANNCEVQCVWVCTSSAVGNKQWGYSTGSVYWVGKWRTWECSFYASRFACKSPLEPPQMDSSAAIVAVKGCSKLSAHTSIVTFTQVLSPTQVFIWRWMLAAMPCLLMLPPHSRSFGCVWERILWFYLLDSTWNACGAYCFWTIIPE